MISQWKGGRGGKNGSSSVIFARFDISGKHADAFAFNAATKK